MATALKLPEGFVLDEEETPKAQLPEGFVLDAEEPLIEQPALEETAVPEAIPPTEQPIAEEIVGGFKKGLEPIGRAVEEVRGLAEAVPSAGVGMGAWLASFPVAAGEAVSQIIGQGNLDFEELRRVKDEFQEDISKATEFLTPKTVTGKKYLEGIAYPFQKYGEAVDSAGEWWADKTGGTPKQKDNVKAFVSLFGDAALLAVPKLIHKVKAGVFTDVQLPEAFNIKNSNLWRRLTIKERGLMVLDVNERIQGLRDRGMTEGQIARYAKKHEADVYNRMAEIRRQAEVNVDTLNENLDGAVGVMFDNRVSQYQTQGLSERVAIDKAVRELEETSAGQAQLRQIRVTKHKEAEALQKKDEVQMDKEVKEVLKEEAEAQKAIEKEEEAFRKEVEKSAEESAKIIEKDIIKTDREIKTLEAKEKLKEKLTAEEKPEETLPKEITDDMMVEVKAVREKTGTEVKIKQNAKEAFKESEVRIKKYKSLMDCISA